MTEINLAEYRGPAFLRRLTRLVYFVNEDAHPLLSGTVRIDGAAVLPGRFDLNAFYASTDRVIFIYATDYEVRMTVKEPVLCQ